MPGTGPAASGAMAVLTLERVSAAEGGEAGRHGEGGGTGGVAEEQTAC